jgi:hypothetical protein
VGGETLERDCSSNLRGQKPFLKSMSIPYLANFLVPDIIASLLHKSFACLLKFTDQHCKVVIKL